MATITLRESTSLTSPGATVKGAPLTNNEVDNNFSNINIEVGVLSSLTTSGKANLVVAVNEVKSNVTTATTIAQSAFAQANTAITIGQSAFAQANTAFTAATSAFASSNTKVTTVAGVTSTTISNAALLAGLLTVDGFGSTLDADTLDGLAGGGSGAYALKANNLSVFASTTSAELAGIISDETGSGSLVFSASPTLTGNITVTGNINVSLDGVFTGNVVANENISISDVRLKENINLINDPFDVLNQLNGVSYNWKLSGSKGYGLIAQDVEQILPEIVYNGPEYKGLAYINLIAFLIEAVKKLHTEVSELKNSRKL